MGSSQRRRFPLIVAALLLALPAGAQAGDGIRITSSDKPLMSGNIDLLVSLPAGHPIGGRFRDDFMYITSTEGLTIWDVSKPEQPVLTGALPLPHFENEDVDLGGDTLLISNDPSEGVGILYVIDISDPHAPVLKSAMPNGFIEIGLGDEPQEKGIGHTASCINRCQFAYLAGTSAGIQIVDLRDPANPKRVKKFVPAITGLASHDVQVDEDGLAWIVGGDGSAAYDTRDPLNPKLVMRTDENVKNSGQFGVPGPDPVFGIGGKGENPIDLIHHDSLRLDDRFSKGKRRAGRFRQERGKTYPAGGDGDVVGIVEEDYSRPTCDGAGSFQTWGITRERTSTGARKLALLDLFTTELNALVSGRGWSPVTGLCSAHYFDQREGLVAEGWYEEGARFLDVRDPTAIKQVGYWVPTKGETWSVLFAPTDPRGEIVYSLDFARGIDVLRINRSDRRARTAPVRRSWLRGSHGTGDGRTGLSRKTGFGFLCRTPAARAVQGPRPPEPPLGVPVPLPKPPSVPVALPVR